MTPSNDPQLWPLVKTMQSLPSLASVQDRNFLVRLLSDRLDTALQVEESAKAHAHLFNIVAACANRSDGLPALLDVVRELDEGSIHLREVERIIAEHTALPLWPEDEREELFALLRGVTFSDLEELYRQVAGPGAPDLSAETSYRDVFYTLETLNNEPDGLPKPILFVEHLASGRRSELAIELRRWADRQANRLGVLTELQKQRRTIHEDGGEKLPGHPRPRTPSTWYFGPPETEPNFPETRLTHTVPVAVYVSDPTALDTVNQALETMLDSAGLEIEDREDRLREGRAREPR